MKKSVVYIVFIIALGLLWEYFGSTNQTVRLLISSPSLVTQYFSENYSELIEATKVTSMEAILGLIIATAFSFGMMVFCFYFPNLMDFILPIMITSQVIPLIVLAPFFILLFGFGIGSKVAMASVMCFFPIFVNFAQGYKSIPPTIHELMHTYNATTAFKIKNVYFPLAMPSIMAGLKISATLSVIGAIVAEFAGAEIGLGKNLFISAIRLEPDLMVCSLFIASILGLVMFYIVSIVDKIFYK